MMEPTRPCVRAVATSCSKRATDCVVKRIPTENLGCWKPFDDLALIINIQQTNDLDTVYKAVKFSCKFTLDELRQRWFELLYDPAISRLAMMAIRNLHPELKESVLRKVLYSVQEEELLGNIKSTEVPNLEMFQQLLDKNLMTFYNTRTAKSLQKHWLLLKKYGLLQDQTINLDAEQLPTFSEAEDEVCVDDADEPPDEALEIELTLADRHNKREIRLVENELARWAVLVQAAMGAAKYEFDNYTFACLCGRQVRYLMRSREITFGRETKETIVDIDLSLEGVATKISRHQGAIKLRSDGDFFIANEGKHAIFIDGSPVLNGKKKRLAHNGIIEICGLRFTFLVNQELLDTIRQNLDSLDAA